MTMPDSEQKTSAINLESWIASLGFERGNPFANVEADQERALLPEYFVDVDAYERIKGDKTIIVFAPRGGGKSALRVVLASQAAPTSPDSKTLAIEYTDFAPLIAKLRAGELITVDDHVNLILRVAVETLFTAFCGHPPGRQEEKGTRQKRNRRVKEILPPVRSRLARWIKRYQPQLLDAEELYERLHAMEPTFIPDWREFNESASQFSLRKLISQSSLGDNHAAMFLADLNDSSADSTDSSQTPKESVSAFLNLARSMGFDAIQVLMDRMDEAEETVNDPKAQADILEPLVAELQILELPGLAFKFLLSQEAHKIIMDRPTFRHDRITDKEVVTVQWDKDRLKKLLDERLEVFSNQKVQELVQICKESQKKAAKGNSFHLAGERIEAEMLEAAQGSPRRLLLGGQLLFEAHVSRSGGIGRIEWEDWQLARGKLLQKMPTLLRLHRDRRQVEVGEREVELTPLQHRILMTLANALNGECDRQELMVKAWDAPKGGITFDTIDHAVSRIREFLGDDAKNPVYLKTIKGRGFQLLHYEVI